MSDISPIGRPNAAALNGSAGQAGRRINGQDSQPRQADRAEFSRAAQYLSRLNELPDVREHLVARVRAEIQAGTYESDGKIDAAIDSLVNELA